MEGVENYVCVKCHQSVRRDEPRYEVNAKNMPLMECKVTICYLCKPCVDSMFKACVEAVG